MARSGRREREGCGTGAGGRPSSPRPERCKIPCTPLAGHRAVSILLRQPGSNFNRKSPDDDLICLKRIRNSKQPKRAICGNYSVRPVGVVADGDVADLSVTSTQLLQACWQSAVLTFVDFNREKKPLYSNVVLGLKSTSFVRFHATAEGQQQGEDQGRLPKKQRCRFHTHSQSAALPTNPSQLPQ